MSNLNEFAYLIDFHIHKIIFWLEGTSSHIQYENLYSRLNQYEVQDNNYTTSKVSLLAISIGELYDGWRKEKPM